LKRRKIERGEDGKRRGLRENKREEKRERKEG
jgi:hypothetical protein